MTRILAFAVLLVATMSLLGSATAKPAHVQNISEDTAHAFCSSNGQAFNDGGCNFCDPQHCHQIQCKKDGCTNTVLRPVTHNPGGPVISGTGARRSGTGAPPKSGGVVQINHPVISSGGRRH